MVDAQERISTQVLVFENARRNAAESSIFVLGLSEAEWSEVERNTPGRAHTSEHALHQQMSFISLQFFIVHAARLA